MRPLLLFISVSILAPVLQGQEPILPKPETQDPLASPSPSRGAVAEPLPTPAPPLIPPDVLPLSERSALPVPAGSAELSIPQLDESLRRSPINAAGQAARQQVEWRSLRNRVANDENLRAKLRLAEKAPTDFKKRQLLRSYYEAYFGRLIALAPTPDMKAFLNDRKKEQLGTLPQPRVRPEALRKAKRS